ncbi:Tyrosine--tRNA ligase [Tritrichomonas foetus]|uniref:tyrosine--tRNA ligase n=1 Tax=Tritrichomonas foetus TaxID=1144522 RepID=A0A1J4JAR6_9EUKA|nr:Tyrosine--tRNA ligase [Tritrichomonas foetus]|eukprot:OHS96270.1 Tyrosine--tRNA ligase [Tritrichomonas foetus]
MDVDAKVAKLLSISADQTIAEQLKAKISSKSDFTVFHAFEPNGRITLAHALRYAIASKIVAECGGKYILFIADIRASQDMFFNRNEAQIKAAVDYSLKVLENLGVKGDHVQVIKSSEFSLNNHELFYQMVSNSIKISINDVQANLPPAGKKEVLSASKMIAPCLHATEIQFLKADVVICPENLAKQLDIMKTFDPENVPVVIPLHSILNLKKTTPVKPDPKNTYFFEDNPSQIGQKSNGAFCTDDVNENPVFQYIAYLILPLQGEFEFKGKKYATVEEISADFASMDKKELKGHLAYLVDQIVDPVRCAFQFEELQPVKEAVAKFNTTIQ